MKFISWYLLFEFALVKLSFINEILPNSAFCESEIKTDLFLPLAPGLSSIIILILTYFGLRIICDMLLIIFKLAFLKGKLFVWSLFLFPNEIIWIAVSIRTRSIAIFYASFSFVILKINWPISTKLWINFVRSKAKVDVALSNKFLLNEPRNNNCVIILSTYLLSGDCLNT